MRKVSLKVGAPLPKSMGACADAWHEVNKLRLAMDKEVKVVKDRETEIKQHIIDTLSVKDDTGAAGKFYRAQIKTEEQPIVEDWEDLYDFVVDEDRFDLLGKSLGTKAAKEMHAAGEKIPGVGKMIVKKLSITKL